MTPTLQYEERAENFGQQANRLQQRENRLSVARLIAFVSGLVLFFVLISFTVTGAILALVVCMAVFGGLVKVHAATEQQKATNRYLETINRREKECLEGNFASFAGGERYQQREHPYTYDLDIFGNASLFQYINRTTSKPAADRLALWLSDPAPISEIGQRQQAVEELKPQIDWRQQLITLGYSNNKAGNDPAELVKWANSESLFSRRKRTRMVTLGLTLLGVLVTVWIIAFNLPVGLLMPVVAINFLYYFSQARKIEKLHNQVSRSSEMLQTYAATIALIEKGTFQSPGLRTLQGTFTGTTAVSALIRKLSKLVSRLDVRLNVMVSIPLNLFFFWDIHWCLALEKWKRDQCEAMPAWFAAMAEFEVLSSFANMAFNNPDWVMPVVVPEYFTLKAENAGHPLIPAGRRIVNSLEIPGDGTTVLVTGSNMSGKSTFLRTCGVNAVLALAGAPVCATAFTLSHVKVFTSMRISDSLEDNTSSFYAELKRLAAIIKESAHNQRVLLLLDEILRGTNSNDRYTGSVALIRQLTGYGVVSMVATHDLKLADLAESLPGQIDNYHFDVKIDGEELYFDYKLNPGICTSMNASILMKKMGIHV